jgi:hypothetical protein
MTIFLLIVLGCIGWAVLVCIGCICIMRLGEIIDATPNSREIAKRNSQR